MVVRMLWPWCCGHSLHMPFPECTICTLFLEQEFMIVMTSACFATPTQQAFSQTQGFSPITHLPLKGSPPIEWVNMRTALPHTRQFCSISEPSSQGELHQALPARQEIVQVAPATPVLRGFDDALGKQCYIHKQDHKKLLIPLSLQVNIKRWEEYQCDSLIPRPSHPSVCCLQY